MAGELDILIEETAALLGYQSFKEEQKKAVKAFVEGKMCLYPFQWDMGSRYVTRYCCWFLTNEGRPWKGGRS